MNILTQNPEVWKKTIFLLTYDENDGYFDHVPPFVAAHPTRPGTGKATKGIDLSLELVELAQDRKRNSAPNSRESAIGLGYRVPMVIASPWSRGGCVCSQVFDHTSVLQLLEKLLSHKLGKRVEEPNITRWRRTVCGDLTSSFQQEAKPAGGKLAFAGRDAFLHRFQPISGSAQRHDAAEFARDGTSGVTPPRCGCPNRSPVRGHPACLTSLWSTITDREANVSIRFEARRFLR